MIFTLPTAPRFTLEAATKLAEVSAINVLAEITLAPERLPPVPVPIVALPEIFIPVPVTVSMLALPATLVVTLPSK